MSSCRLLRIVSLSRLSGLWPLRWWWGGAILLLLLLLIFGGRRLLSAILPRIVRLSRLRRLRSLRWRRGGATLLRRLSTGRTLIGLCVLWRLLHLWLSVGLLRSLVLSIGHCVTTAVFSRMISRTLSSLARS